MPLINNNVNLSILFKVQLNTDIYSYVPALTTTDIDN